MKARLLKLTVTLCSLSILALAGSLHAQDTEANDASPSTNPAGPGRRMGFFSQPDAGPKYDIQIEDGQLSLAPLQGQANFAAVWGPGGHTGIPATVGNLAKYLRAANTNLNIVLSTDAADMKISDLKIRSDMNSIMEALSVATSGNVRGRNATGRANSASDSWFIMAQRPATVSSRTVEVFNLSGYIKTLGTNEDVIRMNLDEIRLMTRETLDSVYPGRAIESLSFKYHPGTSLLIVTGDSDDIDVARKIINALPGQQKGNREDLLLDTHVLPAQK